MKTLLHHLSQGQGNLAPAGAAEVFVLLTLGFFLGMILAVAIGAWVLHRRANHPSSHRQLLMELDGEEQPAPRSTSTSSSAESWERDADWWKAS
jgi:hypothetical protein